MERVPPASHRRSLELAHISHHAAAPPSQHDAQLARASILERMLQIPDPQSARLVGTCRTPTLPFRSASYTKGRPVLLHPRHLRRDNRNASRSLRPPLPLRLVMALPGYQPRRRRPCAPERFMVDQRPILPPLAAHFHQHRAAWFPTKTYLLQASDIAADRSREVWCQPARTRTCSPTPRPHRSTQSSRHRYRG